MDKDRNKIYTMGSSEMYTKLIYDYGFTPEDIMEEVLVWLPEDTLCEMFKDIAKDRDIDLEVE